MHPCPPPPRRMSKRLELNFELSRFCYCCNSVCHAVVVMKCMHTQDTWQKLVIGSPYWNTVVIVVEFSFLVCTVLFALPAFGLTLLSPLFTRMTGPAHYSTGSTHASCFNAAGNSCSLACSFSSTIPEQKERLLIL